MNQKGFATLPLIIIVLLVIAGVGGYLLVRGKANQNGCTLEAKQCPDGSYVGRKGPFCEFAPCPGATSTRISQIQILSPVGGEQWVSGQTYAIHWTGGGGKISIYLIDKSLEPEGGSISKSWTMDGLPNSGSYSFTVPNSLKGTYKFYVSDTLGNYTYSNYFSITNPSP